MSSARRGRRFWYLAAAGLLALPLAAVVASGNGADIDAHERAVLFHEPPRVSRSRPASPVVRAAGPVVVAAPTATEPAAPIDGYTATTVPVVPAATAPPAPTPTIAGPVAATPEECRFESVPIAPQPDGEPGPSHGDRYVCGDTPPPPAAPPVSESSTSESTAPGTYEERNDNGAFAECPDGTAGSATQMAAGQVERVLFHAYVHCEPDGTGSISVSIENTSGRLIVFPDGLRVVLSINRDGSPSASVELNAPDITELAPWETYAGSTAFTPEGPGMYTVDGEVTVELR